MKKLFLKCTVCSLVLLSMLLCISSCLSESEYIYMHDTSEISSIEIVDAYYDHKTGEAFQKSGNAKIVIIKGEEIIEYVDFGADIHRSYQVEGEEEIYVKILAEGAELNISVERELK